MTSDNTLSYRLTNGWSITKLELAKIAQLIQVDQINPDFLPDKTTILGKPSERKEAIFRFAKNLWLLSPEDWLDMEAEWLSEARAKISSTETEGKNNTDDVVSAELLIRIVSTSSVLWQSLHNSQIPLVIANEATISLNQTIADAVTKGRTRMQTIPYPNDKGWITVYGYLRNSGVMVGTGGGKFLPYPEKSLPILLAMLDRNKINPGAYIK